VSTQENIEPTPEKEFDLLKSLVLQREELINEKKKQDELRNYNAAFEIRRKVYDLDQKIRNEGNSIKAVKNGSSLVSFTDKKGAEHKDIPDFTRTNTSFISFDEETILEDPIPDYIPLIEEEVFARKGYVFDAIRIDKDTYILATNGYKEFKNQDAFGDVKTLAEDSEQGYVIATLDQLALISDYYYTRAKAHEKAKANAANKRTEDYYDKLPREKREQHFAQANFYKHLPVAVKKKVTEEDWNKLTLEEKEAHYKPIARKQGKRLTSKLEEDQMWVSFHDMYERFVNPEALRIRKDGSLVRNGERGYDIFGNPETFKYWKEFRYMMSWKIKDIKIQRQFESETRAIAMETSFGESNTNDSLFEQYGILVKRQNGSQIKPGEIEQIRVAWSNINKLYGGLVQSAKDHRLKISHTGNTLVFASKAAGVYIPKMRTIAASNKFGDNQFESIMAHEAAHWIDSILGEAKGGRYASDDFESSGGVIADKLRRNMNAPSDSDYITSTKECFARAMEQYFAIETFGDEAELIYSYTELDRKRPYFSEDHYVSKEFYYDKLRPLIQEFIKEHRGFFKYDIIFEETPKVFTEEKTEIMETQDIPKNNVTLYTKLKGDKTFKASDLQGNQVANLVHAPLVNPDKYLEFRKALIEVAKENPNVVFQIREFGTNKVWYDSSENEMQNVDNSTQIVDPLIGKTVSPKLIPELTGTVEFKDENGYFVKFTDGSDAYFQDHHLNVIEPTPIVLTEKTVEEYKRDLKELIDEELKKYEDSKATPAEARFNRNKKAPRQHLDEISKLLGIYWEEIVSKHPEEFGEFLLLQKDLPSQVRSMARDAANVEWDQVFKKNLTKNLWTLIPDEFKKYKLPKRVNYTPDPSDKGLHNIMSDFIGSDYFRPVMTGVHFDKQGIVATDANKLIFLAHPADREENTYCITKGCLSQESIVKNTKYPLYQRVVPNNTSFVSIHTESLIAYLKTVIAIKYFNPSTTAIIVTFGSDDNIVEMGFNSHLMLSCAEAMYKLGYDEIDIGYSMPNRAAIFCKKGELNNVAKFTVDFALLMPLMLGGSLELNTGTMYFNAESQCVATKHIADKSCLNPVVIERQKNEAILKKAEEALEETKKEKNSISETRAAQKVADKLIRIVMQVTDALNIASGGDLYADIELQKKYKSAMDIAIRDEVSLPISMKVYEILEDENYHFLNSYLSLSGAYGEEQQNREFQFLDNLKPESKQNFLSPSLYRIEEVVAPETAPSISPTNQDIQDAIAGLETMLSYAKGKAKKELKDTIEGMKLLLEIPALTPEPTPIPEPVAKVETPISAEAQAVLKEEWDKMQDFINDNPKEATKKNTGWSGKTGEDFELGIPVVWGDISGELVMRDGKRGISPYGGVKRMGDDNILFPKLTDWNDIKTFSQVNKENEVANSKEKKSAKRKKKK